MCARGELICVLGVTVNMCDRGDSFSHCGSFRRNSLTDKKLTYDGTQAVAKRVEECVSVVFTLL